MRLGWVLSKSSDRSWALDQIALSLVVHIGIYYDFLYRISDSTEDLGLLGERRRYPKRVLWFICFFFGRSLSFGAVPSWLGLLLQSSQWVLLICFAPTHYLIWLWPGWRLFHYYLDRLAHTTYYHLFGLWLNDVTWVNWNLRIASLNLSCHSTWIYHNEIVDIVLGDDIGYMLRWLLYLLGKFALLGICGRSAWVISLFAKVSFRWRT